MYHHGAMPQMCREIGGPVRLHIHVRGRQVETSLPIPLQTRHSLHRVWIPQPSYCRSSYEVHSQPLECGHRFLVIANQTAEPIATAHAQEGYPPADSQGIRSIRIPIYKGFRSHSNSQAGQSRRTAQLSLPLHAPVNRKTQKISTLKLFLRFAVSKEEGTLKQPTGSTCRVGISSPSTAPDGTPWLGTNRQNRRVPSLPPVTKEKAAPTLTGHRALHLQAHQENFWHVNCYKKTQAERNVLYAGFILSLRADEQQPGEKTHFPPSSLALSVYIPFERGRRG